MKKKNRYSSLVWMLLGGVFCFSCTDEIETPDSQIIESNEQGIFMSTPPGLDVGLLRSFSDNIIQENITEQGVSVKISERPWVGMSLEDKPEMQLRHTWDDIVWNKNYANIGVFTVRSSDIVAYEGDGNSAHIKCFPFRTKGTGTTWLDHANDTRYYQPSGNNHANNPYNYHTANLKIDARATMNSTSFFEHSNAVPINFYGYFPYQHQTSGINFTLPSTSICNVLQANNHTTNLLAMPYSFAPSQTKENIIQHDVMYSVSEDGINDGGHLRNRYGNRNKQRHDNNPKKNDNVHMRFVHSFCRLQFKISAGSYRSEEGITGGPIKLSKLSVTGNKVFVDGTLNLIEGKVTAGNASTIIRALDNDQAETVAGETFVDLRKGDLIISMIVQPTDGKIGNSEDFKIICVVDGVEYSCSLSNGVELITNHVYDVNLELAPETKVIVASGGGSRINLYPEGGSSPIGALNGTGEINATFADRISIEPNSGWRVLRIIENGTDLDLQNDPKITELSPGQYSLSIDLTENRTKKYEVICVPNDWYVTPLDLLMHLDGKLNNGFADEKAPGFIQEIVPIWKDLSYNENNGILYNYDLTQYANPADGGATATSGTHSGWDGKGLKCDGRDDFTAFPVSLSSDRQYTISVYLHIPSNQFSGTSYQRIISEGTKADGTPPTGNNGYPSLNRSGNNLGYLGQTSDNTGWVANGLSTNTDSWKNMIQIDLVGIKTGASSRTLTTYINGEVERSATGMSSDPNTQNVTWTSIGGRSFDTSRHIHATYYSVMVYNRPLTAAEIKLNYNLNVERYGKVK